MTISLILACLSHCKLCENSITCIKCYEESYFYLNEVSSNIYNCTLCDLSNGRYLSLT